MSWIFLYLQLPLGYFDDHSEIFCHVKQCTSSLPMRVIMIAIEHAIKDSSAPMHCDLRK